MALAAAVVGDPFETDAVAAAAETSEVEVLAAGPARQRARHVRGP
jgi:hypothetical protein